MTVALIDEQGAPLAPMDQTETGAPLAKPSAETPEQAHVSLMWRWGKMMAASGFFNDSRQAAQAAVKIQAGHELGLSPAVAMRSLYFFDGKLSLATALMTAQVNKSQNYEYEVVTQTDDLCVIKWFGKSKRNGQWREIGESRFDNADVKRAGLENKDNHKKYPRAMKFNRAFSAGSRMYCPELFNGPVYTAEEIGGERVTIDETGNIVTTDEQVPTSQPTLVGDSRAAIADAVRAARVTPSVAKVEPEPELLGAINVTLMEEPAMPPAASERKATGATTVSPHLLQRVIDGEIERLEIDKKIGLEIQREKLNGGRLTQENHQGVLQAIRNHAEGQA
jgi:hypothetical protein